MPASTVDQTTCAQCGGRGWVLEDDDGLGSARPCACRDASRVARLLAAAAIPERYRGCTLDNFQTNLQGANPQLARAHRVAGRYVDAFLTDEGKFLESGLLFVGPPGGGKTHLAAAVLNELVRRYQVRGRFADFTSLIHQIQSTFDPRSPESKREVLDPVIGAELLVLDELGANKPSPWVSDILYLIVNTRYTRKLPTIFTTNYRLDRPPGAGARAVSEPGDGGDGDRPEAFPDDRHGFASAPAAAARTEAADLTRLSSRIPAILVSRLWEMAMPVSMSAVEDFRREYKAHQHRILDP